MVLMMALLRGPSTSGIATSCFWRPALGGEAEIGFAICLGLQTALKVVAQLVTQQRKSFLDCLASKHGLSAGMLNVVVYIGS